MPRRPVRRDYGQKGKSKKGRPRGWHRKAWSPDVRAGVAWLLDSRPAAAEGETT